MVLYLIFQTLLASIIAGLVIRAEYIIEEDGVCRTSTLYKNIAIAIVLTFLADLLAVLIITIITNIK